MLRLRFAVVLALLIVVAVATTRWVHAQTAVQPVPSKVMFGPEVGFRVTGMRGNTPVGTIVVRVNGEWVDVDTNGPIKVTPLR